MDNERDRETSFLYGATLLAAGSLLVVDLAALAKLARTDTLTVPFAGGRLLGTVPFIGEIPIEAGKLWSSGLDARQYADLSSLAPDSLIKAADKFYVRTACPDLIDYKTPWTIKVTTSDKDIRFCPSTKWNRGQKTWVSI